MNDTNTITNIANLIEAILFYKGEPTSAKELHKILKLEFPEVTADDIDKAIIALKETLCAHEENGTGGRGITLIEKESPEKEYMLATSKEASSLIEKLKIDELNKDLGKASLETLSIIIYQGPIRRSQIDNIRGVNSAFIVRNLLVRGLIEKTQDPKDSRTSLYHPSFQLLSHLGVNNIKDLPNFESVKSELERFEKEYEEQQAQQS